jgi:luciferase family oxidoreductase group 1
VIKINILDQSPIREGVSHIQALENTVKVAQYCEKLGYHRYWLSEHHELSRFAGSSPEILVPIIANRTERIRVGAGGVLSPNHNSYKIAESFSQMMDFFPGRIDLGIGRSAGGNDEVLAKLRNGFVSRPHSEFVTELYEHLGQIQKERYLHEAQYPDLWLLGSSAEFSNYPLFENFKYCYGHFIRSNGGLKTVKEFREKYFEKFAKEPYLSVAVHCVCSDDASVLKTMVRAYGISLIRQLKGVENILPSLKTVKSYILTATEKDQIQNNLSTNGVLIGSGEAVASELRLIAKAYSAQELVIVTHGYDLESRMESLHSIVRNFYRNAP